MTKLIAVVTAIAFTGCSFVFTHAPDTEPSPVPVFPECTSNKTWPIIDAVLAGLYLAAGVGAFKRRDEPPSVDDMKDNQLSPKATAALSFGLAAVAGAGAFVGFRRVSQCRRARDAFRAAHPQGVPYYQPLPGAAPPGAQPPQTYVPGPQYPPGYEGGQCWQGNLCAQGLVCGSGLCVRPPPPAPAPAPGGTP